MPIEFLCDCGQPLKAPDDMVGGKARCPTCKKILTIPAESQPLSAAADSTAPDVSPTPPAAETSEPAEKWSGPTTQSICPHCRSEVAIPADRPGEAVHCPRCGGQFLAPAKAPAWPGTYGPPTRAPYAPPPMQYPYGAYRPPGLAPGSVASLVCGILGLVAACAGLGFGIIACVGFVLSMVAIVQGNNARQQGARSPYVTGGMGVAGFVLGIIGAVLQVIGFIFWLMIVGARSW